MSFTDMSHIRQRSASSAGRLSRLLLFSSTIGCVPFLLLLCSLASSVSAETTATLVYPNPPVAPNFSQHPITSIVIIIFVLFMPCSVTGIILLRKRRNHFPIAGRGSAYLMWLGCNVFVYTSIASIVGVAYPNGFPCGIEFFLHYCISIPTGVIYMLRGWTLVFRLEIKNYLTELRWRQEKKKLMNEYQELQQLLAMEMKENESGKSENSKGTAVSVQTDAEMANEDPATIPGYFFIHHRRWIEPKFLFPFVGGWYLIVVISAIILGIFDPDIQLTNAYLHQQGAIPDGVDYTESQFSPSAFLSSPPCLTYAIKTMYFFGVLSSVLLPLLVLCSWRIYLDKVKQAEREKDQAQCYKLIHGKDAEVFETTKERLGLSMDDSQNVKMELGVGVSVVLFDCLGNFILQAYSPAYAVLSLLFIYMALFAISIAMPLYLSYSLSRKHRELIDRSKAACNVNAVKKAGDKDGMYNRLPHQRPYFTLKYILHQSHTYDVLLAFLQKEYSSENALFWSEARSFEKAAKELEAKIPNWPSSMDPDEEQTTHGGSTGGGAGGSALGSAARAGSVAEKTVLRKSSNATSVATPQHPRVTNIPSPVRVFHLTQHSSIDTQLPPPNMQRQNSDTDLPDLSLASLRSGSIANGLSSTTATATTTLGVVASSLSPTHVPSTPISLAVVSPSGPEVIFPPLSPTLKSTPKHLRVSHNSSAVNGSPISDNGQSMNFPSPSPSSQGGSSIQLVSAPVVDFVALHLEAKKLKSWSEKMYDDYMKRSAVMEINIPEDLSKLVQSQILLLSSWSPTPLTQVTGDPDYSSYPLPPPFPLSTLYRATQIAVFDLIQRDSFRRFILTPGFQQLLHQADEDELARLEKQNDLMMDTAEVVDKALEVLSNTPNQTINGIPSQQHNSGVRPVSNLATGGSIIGNAVASRRMDDSVAVEEEDEAVYNLPGTPSLRATNPKSKNPARLSATYQRVIEEGDVSSEDSLQNPPVNPKRATNGSPTQVPGSNTLGAMSTDVRGSISMLGPDPHPFSLGPRAESITASE